LFPLNSLENCVTELIPHRSCDSSIKAQLPQAAGSTICCHEGHGLAVVSTAVSKLVS
jgi:hypothetical protein